MGYTALKKMQEINEKKYGISDTVKIPDPPTFDSSFPCSYGKDALDFLRDDCEDLKFRTDEDSRNLIDSDGRSTKQEQIPYNMERDLDRLCFERAIYRFLKSGTREDAFDIYFCYCEIFHPFGGGYQESEILLKMLSEHESNASSLLKTHRDHYSHSVYVFCMGLAVYKRHLKFRKAYHDRFGLQDGPEGACHFLEWWGLTSLFHDIGYPFEIAHQQMIAYVDRLVGEPNANGPRPGFTPYISYQLIPDFFSTKTVNPNKFYAEHLTKRLATYLQRINYSSDVCEKKLFETLKDRPVHSDPNSNDCYRMDHAYFSALLLLKTYLDHHPEKKTCSDPEDLALLDSFCAIILHNGLFKYTIRKFNDSKQPLKLSDGQPLAYLLMLCDELQCCDRTCYGEMTRRIVFPYHFEMTFPGNNTIALEYRYDQNALDMARKDDDRKTYKKMTSCDFWDDIDDIVALNDVIPEFRRSFADHPFATIHKDPVILYQANKDLNLSTSNYLNLYNFALALHESYLIEVNKKEKLQINAKEDFENNLSLEYKLSNIAQAKRYSAILDKIGCFYTDRPVKYAPVNRFSPTDIPKLGKQEHDHWCEEKTDMGWQRFPVGMDTGIPSTKRERIRFHGSLVAYGELEDPDLNKVCNALNKMLDFLKQFDGLTIYKLKTLQ